MPATMHYNETNLEVICNEIPLRDYIHDVVATYFKNLTNEGLKPENVYELIMAEVELPLIEAVMEYTGNNQSKAAHILGINRGTFRKKLKHYALL